MWFLAVDVGGTSVKAEAVDAEGNARASHRISPVPPGTAALEAIASIGEKLIALLGSPPAAAGVLLPGIVDPVARTGVYSANLGWTDLEFGGPLERAWQTPVAVAHDVTCAGWAEHRSGAGVGVDDLAFLAIGTGISAALIHGGTVLAASGRRQPGEVGHLVVRPGGPQCPCGARGCLETIASAAAIARAYAAATGAPAADGARGVFAAVGGDPVAAEVIGEAIRALADGLAALTAILPPQRVVIGGGLAEAGEALTAPLQIELHARVKVQPVPEIVLARFGERAGLVGAALLAQGL
jgi:glucokinase